MDTQVSGVMFNPPHPGEVLRELYLEPLGLTVTGAADGLGVTRKTLSAIVNGRAGISPEMAMRLAKALRTCIETLEKEKSGKAEV